MNPVADFFARHHAVPATDAGPQWEQATDDALIGWLTGELALLRRGTGDPKRTVLNGVLAEAWKRVERLTKQCAENSKEWPGRNTVGRLLAVLAQNADLLTVAVK